MIKFLLDKLMLWKLKNMKFKIVTSKSSGYEVMRKYPFSQWESVKHAWNIEYARKGLQEFIGYRDARIKTLTFKPEVIEEVNP